LRVSPGRGDRDTGRPAAPRGVAHTRHQPDRHGRHSRPRTHPDRGVWLELMAALAPPAVETAPEPSPKRRRAPAALWAVSLLLILPAVTPIAYLLWSVLRPGGFDAGNIPLSRLVDLLGSTAVLVVTVTVAALVLGTATAWLTCRSDLRGRRLWSTLVTLPLVI